MSDPLAPTSPPKVSLGRIFLEFLIIGGTSFGGVVPYLRGSLVEKQHWLDDVEFTEMLSICQSLPGLNATNMAILVGQRLGGALGSVVAVLGICIPGAVLMYAVGIFYRAHGDHAWTTAALKGVAAAAVGLLLVTAIQLGRKSLGKYIDLFFVALTVIAVNRLHIAVPWALIGVGALAIAWHRPRKPGDGKPDVAPTEITDLGVEP
jgi:chromate transporter